MTTDECIALADDELVDATYALIDDLAESEDTQAAEVVAALIFLFGELLERFAPEAARAELVQNMIQLGPLDAEDEKELLDALGGSAAGRPRGYCATRSGAYERRVCPRGAVASRAGRSRSCRD
jgi:hypothetical protein